MEQDNLLAAVRGSASKMSQEEAASICGLSPTSYRSREDKPQEFRIYELQALYDHVGPVGKKLIVDGVRSLFLDR